MSGPDTPRTGRVLELVELVVAGIELVDLELVSLANPLVLVYIYSIGNRPHTRPISISIFRARVVYLGIKNGLPQ